jgi:outer membrane receptor for Fe3+-dicitrate
VLYGDNASGGVINIITKTGEGKKPEIGFQYRTGSYRYNSYNGFIDGGSKFLHIFNLILKCKSCVLVCKNKVKTHSSFFNLLRSQNILTFAISLLVKICTHISKENIVTKAQQWFT